MVPFSAQIKCDAAVPQCNWCSHHNIPCTFERTIRRRRKERSNNGTGYVEGPLVTMNIKGIAGMTNNIIHDQATQLVPLVRTS